LLASQLMESLEVDLPRFFVVDWCHWCSCFRRTFCIWLTYHRWNLSDWLTSRWGWLMQVQLAWDSQLIQKHLYYLSGIHRLLWCYWLSCHPLVDGLLRWWSCMSHRISRG
jgi:hypothetical protein